MAGRSQGKAVRPYAIGSGGKIVHKYQVDSINKGFLMSTAYDWERYLVHSRLGPTGNPPQGAKQRIVRMSQKQKKL